MTDSHTNTDDYQNVTGLKLIRAVDEALPAEFAGRVEEHLGRFAEHMKEGLLAASCAIGVDLLGSTRRTGECGFGVSRYRECRLPAAWDHFELGAFNRSSQEVL